MSDHYILFCLNPCLIRVHPWLKTPSPSSPCSPCLRGEIFLSVNWSVTAQTTCRNPCEAFLVARRPREKPTPSALLNWRGNCERQGPSRRFCVHAHNSPSYGRWCASDEESPNGRRERGQVHLSLNGPVPPGSCAAEHAEPVEPHPKTGMGLTSRDQCRKSRTDWGQCASPNMR